MTEWHDVARVVHLPGGLRASNNPGPDVQIAPSIDSKQPAKTYRLSTFSSLRHSLESLGVLPIGIDFYTSHAEIDGDHPAEWRPTHPAPPPTYPCWDARDTWSCIAHAAFDEHRIKAFDLAARIRFQVHASVFRLREISEAYACELITLCARKRFREGVAVQSLNSPKIYFSVGAFLVDICVLRDYLAEFLSTFVLRDVVNTMKTATTMASLRAALDPSASDPLIDEVRQITDRGSEGAWLAELSEYRNMVVHAVPIAEAAGSPCIKQHVIRTSEGDLLPAVQFQLPSEPLTINRQRKQRLPWSGTDEWLRASIDNAIGKNTGPDALEYCWGVLGDMASFSLRVAARSPVAPRRASFRVSSDGFLEPDNGNPG